MVKTLVEMVLKIDVESAVKTVVIIAWNLREKNRCVLMRKTG